MHAFSSLDQRVPRASINYVVAISLGFAAIGGINTLVVPARISGFIAPFVAQLLGPEVGAAAAALIVTFGARSRRSAVGVTVVYLFAAILVIPTTNV